ncbi:hypothetical protein Tco_0233387, partial [Tanacetum coccineum]
MMILPLRGCEMVLGIQWLATLGDIKCNFSKLRMEFMYKYKKMILRGTPKAAIQWLDGKNRDKEFEGSANAELLMFCMYPNTGVNLMNLEGQNKGEEIYPELAKVVDTFADVFNVPQNYLLKASGVATDPSKIKAMQGWPVPNNVKQLRGFLGLTGWTDEAQVAFENLKVAIKRLRLLSVTRLNKFHLKVNQYAFRGGNFVITGRVKVPAGGYVVPTGRVKVPAGG